MTNTNMQISMNLVTIFPSHNSSALQDRSSYVRTTAITSHTSQVCVYHIHI